MFNKKSTTILMFLLVLLTLIGLSVTSATDINSNDTIQQVTSEISEQQVSTTSQISTNDNNKINEIKTNNIEHKSIKSEDETGSFADLNTVIEEAKTSDKSTITLDKDYQSTEENSIFELNQTMIIDGNGHTIDYNQHNGTFKVTSDITIKNVKITNYKIRQDAAFTVSAGGKLTFINVTVSDITNTTYASRGFINTTAVDVAISIYNSTFRNVDQISNGVIYIYNTRSNLTIENSIFDNITSQNGAINFNTGGLLSINNSNFTNNYASNYGGAINTRTNTYGVFITNSYFKKNSAGTYGGAIAIRGANATIENNTFIENNASSSYNGNPRGSAGAIHVAGNNIFIINNTMQDNYGAINGSDIGIFSNYKLNSTVIVTAPDTTIDSDEPIIVKVRVTDDKKNEITGGIATLTVNSKTYSATVINGTAIITISNLEEDKYEMSVTYDRSENLTIVSGTLTYGTVLPDMTDYTSLQDAINYVDENVIIKLKKNIVRADSETCVNITKNITINGKNLKIDASEGTMFNISNDATLTLTNITLTNVSAQSMINITSGNLILNNVTIEDNKVISNQYNPTSLIKVTKDTTLLINNTIIRNIKGSFIDNLGNVTINNTSITDVDASSSVDNAVIKLTGNLSIINSSMNNNKGYSGMIYGISTSQTGTLLVDNSTFIGNTVSQGNGGVITTGNNTNITNSYFKDNSNTHADKNGGAIYISNGLTTIINSTFINNIATGNGSAVATGYNGNFNITNSVLLSNTTNTILFNGNNKISPVANYNWWGSNSNPSDKVNSESYYDEDEYEDSNYPDITVTNWVIMNVTLTEDPEDNSVFTVETTFNKYTDSSSTIYDLVGGLPKLNNVKYTATAGSFVKDETEVIDGKTTNRYNAGLTDATITISQDDQNVVFEVKAPVIDPKNYKGFQKLIDAANSNDVITLTQNLTRASSETTLNITKDLVIDGAGFTLNAKEGTTPVLNLSDGVTLTIKNIIITNSSYAYGALTSLKNANLILENVTITNFNVNTGYGDRGVIIVDTTSNLTMNNSNITNINAKSITNKGITVINNSIVKNVTTTSSSDYGWLTNTKELYIYNSVFTNNTGYSRGLYSSNGYSTPKSILVIDNSTFIGNTVNQSYTVLGGAIADYGNATITKSTFINNSVTTSSSYGSGRGGAIYTEGNLTISNSVFIGNSAKEGSNIYNGNGYSGQNNKVLVNNNWWGNNKGPQDTLVVYSTSYSQITADTWVIMNATLSDAIDNTYTITTTFNKVTDSEGNIKNLEGSLPEFTVEYTASDCTVATENSVVKEGITTNTMTDNDGFYVVKVIQANQVITFSNLAPIIITNTTYPDFFNEDGTPKDVISEGATIKLSGLFTNKNFTFDFAVNITSDANQAILTNSSFIFTNKAENSNITNLIISNEDYSSTIFNINTNNILIKNNTLTQVNTAGTTHAITLNGTENIIIENNTINVSGLTYEITYDSSGFGLCNLSAIQAFNTKFTTINNNSITTEATGHGSGENTMETMVGVDFPGSFELDYDTYDYIYNKNFNASITNNNITTKGSDYTYGIRMSNFIDGSHVENNTIVSNGTYFANGIELGAACENIVKSNNITVNAENYTYGITVTTNSQGSTKENIVDSNIIIASANDVYGIELYGADENSITNNTINGTGNYTMGIGMYLADENEITGNNITLTADSSATKQSTSDLVGQYVAGILVNGRSNAKDNNIKGNIITINDNGKDSYTVNIVKGSSNTVQNNTLITSHSQGDKSVNASSDNTVSSNLPSNELTITAVDVTFTLGTENTYTATIKDSEGNPVTIGNIIFTDNTNTFDVAVENGVASFKLTTDNVEKTVAWTATYVENEYYNSKTVDFNMNLVKQEPTISIETGVAIIGDNLTITAKLASSDNTLINSGRVVFKINGKTLRNSDGNVIYVQVENGVASTQITVAKNYFDKCNITVVYSGSSQYTSSRVSNIISVNKRTANMVITTEDNVKAGETITLKANVTYNKVAVTNGKVVFKLNGKTLRDNEGNVIYGIVDSEGIATISYTLPAKMSAHTYRLTAVYGNNLYERCEVNSTLTIVK
ncbi:hypothetical protein [Methanosphaera sp. WGK6]|uniref:beta strand repeat-containing protein n=1 Tax=Methanosphaera sp. WGK6 TaxID=1561964 RepID=UPI00084C7D95|nr:hypothetical protein [Methanosphaera sp. WGK6]OED29516.1 hypothetical protein NL43_07865 [Methanosphaera sp. WGK6]